ncbi:MAG: hypothetical protein DWG76_02895 [Chloroflexi bacterium]|nr:molybdopterin-dependent oxidoreductase [Chloroflexota bacterium]MQC26381.1 hypothetical protein [Chloroflexota bacterium]
MESTPDHASSNSPSLWVGAGLGALSSLAAIGLMFLGDRLFSFPFVPFDIFDWMARTLPGGLIAFVTRTMTTIIGFFQGFLPIGDTSTVAKLAEQSIAILQLIGGGIVFGVVLAWLGRDKKQDLVRAGQIGGLILLAVTLLIESSLAFSAIGTLGALWLALLFVGWGWILGWLVGESAQAQDDDPAAPMSRRQFLTVSGAGLSAVALGAWGLGKLFGEDAVIANDDGGLALNGDDPFGTELTSGPAASPSAEALAARRAPIDGTRAELTATEDFYRIDINTRPPSINGDSWRLAISGLVDQPLELSLADLQRYPSQTQILTMQCISNPVGGDLTSSARWTGVRFKDILEDAGIQSSAAGALISSVDGFFEFVVMEDIIDERTLLVYEMNSETLTVEHGFPLRIYIPNRYGMKQPKWINSIQLVEERVDGYWVERGWSREARPQTVSVVDTVALDLDESGKGSALCGGIAWAGGRGISQVEVQVDESGWQSAELITPPLSPLNWVLWRYEWPYEGGRHNLSVRAYDANGELQALDSRAPRPDGATGIHQISVNI